MNKPIVLKVKGTDVPDLTLIDLPGITRISTEDQIDIEVEEGVSAGV